MKTDKELGIICLCALRYCFRRRTYIPSVVTDFIKRNWKYIAPEDRNLLVTEIHDALDKHEPGNPFYDLGYDYQVKDYQNFFKWMVEQEEKLSKCQQMTDK